MKIEDKLEIVIPTFNRCEKLGITFSYLLGENSPVKNCDITILDNCSTDDTPNLVKKIAEKHPNVKYRRNARNIGSVSNIDRSVEIAEKQYLWVIGDDDMYDWGCWGEVEKAIENEVDVIVVGYGESKWKPEDLRALAVCPGGEDIIGCLIINMSFVDNSVYFSALSMRECNINCAIGVMYCNSKPDFRVAAVSRDVTLTFEEEVYDVDRMGVAELFSLQGKSCYFCALFLKDKKLLNTCIKYQAGIVSCGCVLTIYFGMFSARFMYPRSLIALFSFPWKWKLYLLAVGHWKLFKRLIQRLVLLDFKIRRMSL